MQKILIVDDEKPTRDAMSRALGRSYDCLTAPDAELALKAVRENPDLALVITDYKMPGENGLTLIKKAKSANPALGAILITAFGEIELAVSAMKEGADDFLTKPITDLDQLEFRVAQAIKTTSLEKQVAELKSQLGGAPEDFIGKSPAMEKVYRLIRKVAPTNATVLIEGPSGTGKELTARAIHNLSPRAKGPFVAVECASLPASLLEAELFGAVRGAFTGALDRAGCFETADGGTLFLDEIGEIDQPTQVKLLRVLESHVFQRVGETRDRTSDFRLVAATNKNLLKLVADGTFREDLFYRLNVIDIRTPPLKDHREDIALLVSRFLKEFSAKTDGVVTGIEPAALKALEAYDWPGNVRQLRNVVERMVVLASGPKLTVEDLPAEVVENEVGGQRPEIKQQDDSVPDLKTSDFKPSTLAAGEREQILAALERCHGNKSKAADILGISRRTVHRKLKEWGL